MNSSSRHRGFDLFAYEPNHALARAGTRQSTLALSPAELAFSRPRISPINPPRSIVILGDIACMTRMNCGRRGGCLHRFLLPFCPQCLLFPLVNYFPPLVYSVGFPTRLSALGHGSGHGSGSGSGSWFLVLGFFFGSGFWVLGSRIFLSLLLVVVLCTSLIIDPDIPADSAVIVSQSRGPVSTA